MKVYGLCLFLLLSATHAAVAQPNPDTENKKRYARTELCGKLVKPTPGGPATWWQIDVNGLKFSLELAVN